MCIICTAAHKGYLYLTHDQQKKITNPCTVQAGAQCGINHCPNAVNFTNHKRSAVDELGTSSRERKKKTTHTLTENKEKFTLKKTRKENSRNSTAACK